MYEMLQRNMHKVLVYAGFALAAGMPFIKKPYRFLSVHLFLFLGIQLLFIPETRYTIGMMPFLIVTVSAVVVSLIGYVWKKWQAYKPQPKAA
jgi:uncharacterized membrane protein